MKGLVSKVRAKKTKSREKQASKASLENVPWKQRPLTGIAIVVLLWLFSVAIIGINQFPATQTGAIASFPLAAFLPLTGMAVLLLLAILGFGLGMMIVEPDILKQNSKLLMLSLISLISLITVKAVLYITSHSLIVPDEIVLFLVPLGIAPLLTTILVGSRAGIVTGCWTSIAISCLLGNDYNILMIGLITTIVAAHTADSIKSRTKVIKTGFLIGLCKIALVLSDTASNWQSSDVTTVLYQASACFISGLISAGITLVLLSMFESLFRITTNISLRELADLSHPLLQRLAIEAPGTYHHSLVVANLAQAAADEIGANALLARICAYFHDVGKLIKPDFFAENIQLQQNPHDNLPPSMSTLVITAHVKEGLSLAVLHKLPPPILDVIREHHGTSLLSYFHHKAKSQLEFELGQQEDTTINGPAKLDEGDFRYPGPKPRSRESAIICLADPVEAASRTMKKTGPSHIEGMINDIIMTRLRDGQLDDCSLSFSELTKIRRSFVFTLTSMMHARVPYPENEDRDKQQPNPASSEQQNNKGPDNKNNGQGQEK